MELKSDRLKFDIPVFEQEKMKIQDSIESLKNFGDSLRKFSSDVSNDLDSFNELVRKVTKENTQFSKANEDLADQLRRSAASLSKKIEQVYLKSKLSGTVTFNYSNNNGVYVPGKDGFLFATAGPDWESTGFTDTVITLVGVARADGVKEISEITDPTTFDLS